MGLLIFGRLGVPIHLLKHTGFGVVSNLGPEELDLLILRRAARSEAHNLFKEARNLFGIRRALVLQTMRIVIELMTSDRQLQGGQRGLETCSARTWSCRAFSRCFAS